MSEVANLWVSVKADTSDYQRKLALVDSQAAKTAKGAERATQRIGAAWKGLAGLAALGAAGKEVVGFDKAMRNVNSIAQLSEGNFKSLSKSVLSLAGPTAQAPKTLAEGMYTLVSSGFSANQSLTVLKSSAKAASAGLTDTATATGAVAGVLNAYKLKARDAAQVSDDLFQTVNLGVLSFQDLAQGIGPVLPFATRLGVSLKQVGAMTTTLTKAGIPAAEAFTFQKGAMAALVKPTDDLAKVFHSLGVASGKELVEKTGSLQSALELLYQKIGNNDQVFAKLFPDIRGMSAAFAATGGNAKAAAADLDGFKNTAGATDKVLKEQKKSLDFQWRQFKADLASVVDTYGKQLIPTLSGALKIIKATAPAIIAAGGAWVAYKTVALAQIALVKAAELGLFGSAMRAKTAGSAGAAGALGGKTFAAKFGLAAAAGIGGFEFGKVLYKHSGFVRTVGDALGGTFGKAFYHTASQEIERVISGPMSRAFKTITMLGYGQTGNQFNNPAVVPRSAFGKPKGSKGGLNTGPISLGGGSKGKGGGVSLDLSWARQMVGHFQESSGFNRGPELDQLQRKFGTVAAAWCAEFATTALVKAGAPKSILTPRVGDIRAWANAGTHGLSKGMKSTPRAGDLMLFGNGHIGIVDKVLGNGQVRTIEGNTSAGKVQYVTRSASSGDYARIGGSQTDILNNLANQKLGGKKAPKIPNVIVPDVNYYDKMQKQLDHIQLLADAGLIPTDEGIRRERSLIKKFLKFLTGDDRLKAMRDLRNLPTLAKRLPTSVPETDSTINNPMLQAQLAHQDNLAAAGEISQAQADEMKSKYLNEWVRTGHLTGEDALVAKGMINSLSPDKYTPAGWEGMQATLALAGLTNGIKDDLAALKDRLLPAAQGSLNSAIAAGDNSAIVKWANEVKNLNESIKALKESIDDDAEQAKRQHDLDSEQIRLLRRALAVSQSETSVLGRLAYQQLALVAGTRAGLGRLTPTTSNAY